MDESVYKTKTVLHTAEHEGEDIGKMFVESLTEDMRLVYEILKNNEPMVMSEVDKKHHTESRNCYACGDRFGNIRTNEFNGEEEGVIKCRDHCHITSKYRGAACDKCNLRMRVPMFVPILFHNLEGYDSHLFIRSLGLTEGNISCIPKTDEKYISFSKDVVMEKVTEEKPNGETEERDICLELRFLDPIKFTLKSLDSLVSRLGEDQFGTLTDQMNVSEEKESKKLSSPTSS